MGYPTNDDLKAMLTKAAEYKKAEADRIQAMITEAKTRAERLEAELKRWEAFTPHNVYEEMQENDRRKTWETEHREEQEYRDRAKAEDAASQDRADRMQNGVWGAIFGFFVGWSIGVLFG